MASQKTAFVILTLYASCIITVDLYRDNSHLSKKKSRFPRIMGGYSSEIFEHPYIVYYLSGCGGSIIGDRWILTAAHCRKSKYIRVGSSSRASGGRLARIKNHFTHKYYNLKPLDYDFQLLELEEPLKFSKKVQPIKLGQESDYNYSPDSLATVSGWGSPSEKERPSLYLMSVNVPLVKSGICRRLYKNSRNFPITPRVVCAGYLGGNKSFCRGDSGGPLAINGKLIGVASFAFDCDESVYPLGFAKVSTVRNWIQEMTGI